MDCSDLVVNLFYSLGRRSFDFYISFIAIELLFLFDILKFVFLLNIYYDRLLRIVKLFHRGVSFQFVILVTLFGLLIFHCLFPLFLMI